MWTLYFVNDFPVLYHYITISFQYIFLCEAYIVWNTVVFHGIFSFHAMAYFIPVCHAIVSVSFCIVIANVSVFPFFVWVCIVHGISISFIAFNVLFQFFSHILIQTCLWFFGPLRHKGSCIPYQMWVGLELLTKEELSEWGIEY